VNRETYAALHQPATGTSAWDEGVAFAATMQTRHSWLSDQQTTAAAWARSGGVDSLTWWTTLNGQPIQFIFTSSACPA
jgi:hypothetical protein